MGIEIRRESAKRLMEAQLLRGTKPEKINGRTTSNMVPLTDADKTRINKELTNQSKNKKIKI